MDPIIPTNIKSFVTLVHLSGLALGLGGAWMLDIYIIRKMLGAPISGENIRIIHFVSKLVTLGLGLLWLSGLGFIGLYYLYQPELLLNQKVWAKVFIVLLLTINGFYLHNIVIPIIARNKGGNLIESVRANQLNTMTFIGSASCISWLFAMVLGVFSSLNFTVSAIEIVLSYIAMLILSLCGAFFIKGRLLEYRLENRVKSLSEALNASNVRLIDKEIELRALTKYLESKA